MKKGLFVLAVMMALTGLVGCGGSGGGGGGGTPSSGGGSASFENLSAGSSGNQCVKNNALFANYAVPADQPSCVSASGTWHPTNSVSTVDTCRLGGINFLVIGGGSASGSHQTACSNAGGTFIASTTINQPYCSGYTALTCAQAGGTQITVGSTTGDINQSTVNLVAGSNTISADSGLTFLVHGSYDGLNATEYPVYFSVVSKIKYLGSEFWTATFSKPTGTSFSGYFGYNTDTPSFTVSLPVGTSANVVMTTTTLYTGR